MTTSTDYINIQNGKPRKIIETLELIAKQKGMKFSDLFPDECSILNNAQKEYLLDPSVPYCDRLVYLPTNDPKIQILMKSIAEVALYKLRYQETHFVFVHAMLPQFTTICQLIKALYCKAQKTILKETKLFRQPGFIKSDLNIDFFTNKVSPLENERPKFINDHVYRQYLLSCDANLMHIEAGESAIIFAVGKTNIFDTKKDLYKIIEDIIENYVNDPIQKSKYTKKVLDIAKETFDDAPISDLAVICIPKEKFVQIGYAAGSLGKALPIQNLIQLEQQQLWNPHEKPIQYRVLPHKFTENEVKSYIVSRIPYTKRLTTRLKIRKLAAEIFSC